MAKKQKFYVVWKGHTTGIFTSWEACQRQIQGYPDAQYKAFANRAQAEYALKQGYRGMTTQDANSPASSTSGIIRESLAVDAACSGNPGVMEYQGVEVKTGQRIFHNGPFPKGTNNIGEFLAIVHALAYLKRQGDSRPVYTDSGTAMAWVRHKKAKTKLVKEPATAEVWHLIHRAEAWLKNNTYSNPVLKWDTKSWGEIPADFGRK